jgi:signal transduction histidine kinase
MTARSSRPLWPLTAISGLALLGGLSFCLGQARASVPAVGLLVLGVLLGLVALVAPAARPAPAPVRPARAGVVVAGTVMLGGLILLVGVPGAETAGLEMTAAGLASGALLVAPGLLTPLRQLTWGALALGLIAVAVVVLNRVGLGFLAAGDLWLLAASFGAGAGGLLLLADALGASQRQEQPERSAWALINGARGRGRATVWRGVGGALMVFWATGVAVALAAAHAGGHPLLVTLSALGVTIAAVLVIGTPLLVTTVVSRQRLASERTRADERQRIAAHLHDSVLQTLALVQRQAGDPAAVTRLARRQELSLRNWMAGKSELTSGTLAAALAATVIEVEDAAEVSVELSVVGDRPTEPRDEALLSAAREALRNAVRHARGSPASVFAEVTDGLVEVFVSDEGPGFVLADVPETRRGIRDAIIARMQAVGGSAEITAQPGHGTDVLLRLPAA